MSRLFVFRFFFSLSLIPFVSRFSHYWYFQCDFTGKDREVRGGGGQSKICANFKRIFVIFWLVFVFEDYQTSISSGKRCANIFSRWTMQMRTICKLICGVANLQLIELWKYAGEIVKYLCKFVLYKKHQNMFTEQFFVGVLYFYLNFCNYEILKKNVY